MSRNGHDSGLDTQSSDAQIPGFTLGTAIPCVDTDRIERAVREILLATGNDPDRPGLAETPARVARFYREFFEYEPGKIETVFESQTVDQMVAVTGMRVWSLCEHHMLPFWTDISVAYITRDKVIGLSKLARIAQLAAHDLQIQERLVTEIADMIEDVTGSPDVAVIGRGVHLCMVMRGIKTPGEMVSSVMRGTFKSEASCRQEFLMLSNSGRSSNS